MIRQHTVEFGIKIFGRMRLRHPSIRPSYVACQQDFPSIFKTRKDEVWKHDLFMKLIYFSHYFIFVFIPRAIIIIVTFANDVTRNK